MADDALVDTPTNGDAPEVLTSRKSSTEEPYRPGEAETVEWVEGLREEAGQAKKQQCAPESWEDDLSCYWGDQWPTNLPGYKPRIVVNEIQSLFLQELSDLTDSRLVVYVQKDANTLERDTTSEHTIQTFWRRKFADMVIMQAALDAMVFPLGFYQTGWDPTAEQGQGQVIFRHRDPRTVFPDADAETDDDMRFFVLEDVLDLIQIRRDFPETGWLVEPEAGYSLPMTDHNRRVPRGGAGYTGPLYTQTPHGTIPGYRKARARMLTCVVDDDELVEELHEHAGDDGVPSLRAVVRPKYPHRRMIIVANRRVLYDDDCPYHYAPMLTSVALQPRIHAYWPMVSLVAAYRSIQETSNKADSMVAENMLRMNLGAWFADADSGINPQNFGNIPGTVYLIKPGSRVEGKYTNPMNPEQVGYGERLRGNIRTNFGYPASRTGAGTHGNVAAELVETEISQSMGLTRLRGRLMYQAVQRAVEMIFARMAQFYTTPRHLPYIENGSLRSIKWEPIADPSTYMVHVDEASFTVRSKTMEQRLAVALAKFGKMPTKRLLKTLEIPDADKIAEELTQELALQAMARIKQQGGKGGRGK